VLSEAGINNQCDTIAEKMSLVDVLREVVGIRTASTSTLYECRHCGTTPPGGYRDVSHLWWWRTSPATSSEGLSFSLHSLLSEPFLFASVRLDTHGVNGDCLSKRCLLVSEADGDEVVEEVVEPIDVAGRIGREVVAPTR